VAKASPLLRPAADGARHRPLAFRIRWLAWNVPEA
jgi:hypothetical protein